MRSLSVIALLALSTAAAAGCDREQPFSPPGAALPDTVSARPAPGGALGLVEVTITGIGAASPSATAVPYGSGGTGALGPGPRFNLEPVTDNAALALDGDSDYVRADGVSTDAGDAPALTLEAWVYPEAESGGQQAVLAFHTSANDNRNLLLYEPDRDGFAYYDEVLGYIQTPVGAYPPGRWHHVAVVIDASDQGTLYVDGVPLGSSFTTAVRPELGGRFSIGQEYDAGGPTDFLRGRIDEVRVWTVARSEAEIQADMVHEIDPATAGLIAYFRFGEEQGTAVAELAGGNDGTIEGDPTLGAPGPELADDGDGTIRLEPLSTGSFTTGARGNGGFRYLYATFRVRNAQKDGTPYSTPRENLTFLAVDTDDTHGHTAVSRLATFGGTEITGAAAVGIAEGMIPTGRAVRTPDDRVLSKMPDVLQVLTETETAAVDLTDTEATDVFPYGFVVRTPGVTPGNRTLPGSPAADQFDGLVTFAFKVPLQATPADDPFGISVVFLPVEDSETRLTQSIEEQGAEARAAFEARAAELGASELTLLPGGDYEGTAAGRLFCQPVRVAGAAGAATALLFPDPAAFLSLSPDPFAADGSASRIPGAAAFSATFDGPVPVVDAASFVVHGFRSGRVSGAYTGAGTTAIGSPAGNFFPGEVVGVALSNALNGCRGRVARYRVAVTGGSATFSASGAYTVTDSPGGITAGDLDGDGDLDLVTANEFTGDASVLLNTGAAAFAAHQDYGTLGFPNSIAAGDLDGDGDLDLAVSSSGGVPNVRVLLNDGSGAFDAGTGYGSGPAAYSVVMGDLNGDGDLDLATADGFGENISVLLNAGDGTFGSTIGVHSGSGPEAIAAGDLDGDGDLDLAVANTGADSVAVLLNVGFGAFAAGGTYGVGVEPRSVAAGDLDGDGDLDLAVANIGSDDVSVLLNQGAGTFAVGVAYGSEQSPGAVRLGDLDGDADLDMVVLSVSGPVQPFLNGGTGTFTAATIYDGGTSPNDVVIADLDGDDDLDLATAAGPTLSAHVTVLLNQ